MRATDSVRPVLLLAFLLMLAACNKGAPNSTTTAEANAPRSVAEQEKEIAARLKEQKDALDSQSASASRQADRDRMIAPFNEKLDRLDQLRLLMSRKERAEDDNQLVALFNKLTEEVNQLEANNCLAQARSTLIGAINQTKALVDLAKQNPVPADFQDKNKAAAEEQGRAREQIAACSREGS